MALQFLSKADLIHFNRKLLIKEKQSFSEPHNLKNEDALDYLVGMISNNLYYPNFLDKASLYVFNINTGHIFNDGNKRTALMALHAFLMINGWDFNEKLEIVCKKIQVDNGNDLEEETKLIPQASSSNSKEILENFILDIAKGRLDREEIKLFLHENIKEV